MAVRQVLGAVGFVVGAYFGVPQLGYAIGSAIGNAVDPQIIKGPAIGDIPSQSSQEGLPRPIVFALSAPMPGNIIATGPPRILRRRSGGKGGPKVETESVYRTYAIGVCEGPITRFVRVWRNGEVVYDAQDQTNYELPTGTNIIQAAFRIAFNNQIFSERVTFYLGSYDQEADPALEVVFGVGTTPSHRGTAYMVVDRDDLTDLRGAIPQYMFQVERCEGTYLTSRPYPAEVFEALNVSGAVRDTDFPMNTEALALGADVVFGALGGSVENYSDGLPEALAISASVGTGTLDDVLIEYEDALPEALNFSGAVIAGTLDDVLIEYEDGLPEALDISGSVISGSLT